jgi:16S rRNA (cytidine1402-2'-O)-methyltransferase
MIKHTIQKCDAFFVENLRTARRAFKKIDRTFDIDARLWFEIENKEENHLHDFKRMLAEGKTVGIVSESGCPGIADPGQKLVAVAQQQHYKVIPITGPSSILLALMASGMNGQHFNFVGYLPISTLEREKKIKELEKKCNAENCTIIFIETPYRNNPVFQSLISCLQKDTKLCIGHDITSPQEWIITKTVEAWKKETLELPKQPTIFLLGK